MPQYKQALVDGLWRQNPGLVQFLGICPLLAVSNSAVNGIALGAATLVVLVLSNSLISMLRPLIPRDIRLPVFVLVIASLVPLIERAFEVWYFDLWLTLGIFLPLITSNCAVLCVALLSVQQQHNLYH